MWPPPPEGTWVVDLDGVVWLTERPIPGGAEAVARLRAAGVRVLFATNNSAPTHAELHRRLATCGITADDADVVTSADVAAEMLAPGSSALVLGADGVVEALARRKVSVVADGPVDAVVVGLTRALSYEALSRAAAAVRAGARLIGTNEDPTYPTPEGLLPGAGALLAAVATAAETAPEVAGKPRRPTADAVAARAGAGEVRALVGDRPATDGALAVRLGVPFALVLSGVTSAGAVPADAGAAVTAADLHTLVSETL